MLLTGAVCVLVQVMFEKYQCAGVYIAIQAVLTLYAQGKSHDLYGGSHDPFLFGTSLVACAPGLRYGLDSGQDWYANFFGKSEIMLDCKPASS